MNFHLEQLKESVLNGESSYLEFLRVPTMSAGLYRLAAGELDKQLPHTEDELYFIVQGAGQFNLGDQNQHVSSGSIIFVEANVEHRFHSITEELFIFVLFAPAEYSNRTHVDLTGQLELK
ncbi:cupin domain-containing protein [Paenibacillus sp. L3-i20]|uniref:cupin domain-containing protein n=1 Tax=Paenibacillus sp. L3-i20 TaxID=2905833 RepID=UPI001EE061F5|nr:cupin domain-containing protein [Paenibacillus sp. L3-i20]GKU78810.1 hypothetical protein L3i20_v232070 [Paenibacillus sp. L3-i20]